MTERFAHFTRREFLQRSGMFVAGMAATQLNPHRSGIIARPLLDVNALARFVDPLPVPPILKPSGTRPSPDTPAAQIPYYRVEMRALRKQSSSRCEGHAPLGIWRQLAGADLRDPQRRTPAGRVGQRIAGIAFSSHRPQRPWRGGRQAGCSRRHPPAWRESSRQERRLSGRLVGAGQIGALLLPQSSGRGHALVPRPRAGNHPPEYVCRTLRRVRHSR